MIQHIHSIHSLSLANWLTLWTLFTWLPISILGCGEDVKSSVRYKCKKGEASFFILWTTLKLHEYVSMNNINAVILSSSIAVTLPWMGYKTAGPWGKRCTRPPTLLQRIKTSGSRTHKPQLRCSRAVLCLTGAALCFDLNVGYHFLAVLSHFVCFFCSFYVPL